MNLQFPPDLSSQICISLCHFFALRKTPPARTPSFLKRRHPTVSLRRPDNAISNYHWTDAIDIFADLELIGEGDKSVCLEI